MARGHKIGVDGDKFHSSIHGSLQCGDCHADIKEYPHPDHPAKVQCSTCHADQASSLKGSVHADSKDHPCTSCHGDAHAIFPKTDARSAVYPLNIPATCGQCHGNNGMAQKHGLASVYPHYIDSIHGFALSKEGLLVAANCQSCHGSHNILSHTNPASPTFKANIPKTCGQCHAKINDDYTARRAWEGNRAWQFESARCARIATRRTPSCSPPSRNSACSPRRSAARATRTVIHLSRHVPLATRFAGRIRGDGAVLGLPRRARDIARQSTQLRRSQRPTWSTTCGRCHAGANLSFVQYQPHANAHDRKLNPALYFIRLFMNVLLISVLTFFIIHTILWLVRSRLDQVRKNSAGRNHHA